MDFVAVYFVQGKEGLFLTPDGDGGVDYVHLISEATPFDHLDSAEEAVIDYFDGHGIIWKTYKLNSNDLRRN